MIIDSVTCIFCKEIIKIMKSVARNFNFVKA